MLQGKLLHTLQRPPPPARHLATSCQPQRNCKRPRRNGSHPPMTKKAKLAPINQGKGISSKRKVTRGTPTAPPRATKTRRIQTVLDTPIILRQQTPEPAEVYTLVSNWKSTAIPEPKSEPENKSWCFLRATAINPPGAKPTPHEPWDEGPCPQMLPAGRTLSTGLSTHTHTHTHTHQHTRRSRNSLEGPAGPRTKSLEGHQRPETTWELREARGNARTTISAQVESGQGNGHGRSEKKHKHQQEIKTK